MALKSLRRANPAPPAQQRALVGVVKGEPYQLGPQVGSGGEGIVYAIARRPELLAKIYRRTPSQRDVDKLKALVRSATPDLLGVTAWPLDCLKTRSGAVVGFVMPRIEDARGIHELYSPRGRVRTFPSADFRFLVHVAANVARLFASVHQAGFIIGDVNHGNIFVRNDGTVAAIDCDSFQVGDGVRFPCRVGVELFTPPEVLGRNLASVRRTSNHDAFGLAVLIFHLLFMGRHPFAGRFLGLGEMPIERAIAECRFAYSRDAGRTKMSPPPFTVPLSAATPAIAECFERAFHPDGCRGGRPTPEDWVRTLEALKASLTECSTVAWHQYPSSLKSCPWCAIERGSGAKLFGGVVRVVSVAVADLQTLWTRYLAIADPGPPWPLPREEDWVPPAGPATTPFRRASQHAQLTAGLAGITIAALGVTDPIATLAFFAAGTGLVLTFTRRRRASEAARTAALEASVRADQAWQALAVAWQAQRDAPDFTGKRREIEALKTKHRRAGPRARGAHQGRGTRHPRRRAARSVSGSISHRGCRSLQYGRRALRRAALLGHRDRRRG